MFGYLTIVFIALKNSNTKNSPNFVAQITNSNNLENTLENSPKNLQNKLTWSQFWVILVQITISPFIYFLMAIPALDVQIRGLLGNYLGYWVTPKK